MHLREEKGASFEQVLRNGNHLFGECTRESVRYVQFAKAERSVLEGSTSRCRGKACNK